MAKWYYKIDGDDGYEFIASMTKNPMFRIVTEALVKMQRCRMMLVVKNAFSTAQLEKEIY